MGIPTLNNFKYISSVVYMGMEEGVNMVVERRSGACADSEDSGIMLFTIFMCHQNKFEKFTK